MHAVKWRLSSALVIALIIPIQGCDTSHEATNPPECEASSPCHDGLVCQQGVCTDCRVDADCMTLQVSPERAMICSVGHCREIENPPPPPPSDKTCKDLKCDLTHLACEESPKPHCSGCLPGYVLDGSSCRQPYTCLDFPCSVTELCIGSPSSDRVCEVITDPEARPCGNNASIHRDNRCVSCNPACNRIEGSTGKSVRNAINGIACACETGTGYFISPGENASSVEVAPCDADGDGWVRDSILRLKNFKNAETTFQTLMENNKCSINVATHIELQDEYGRVAGIVDLAARKKSPIPLLESIRNDDAWVMKAASNNAIDGKLIPRIGGALLAPEMVNSLTKYCATPQGDFNDNGMPDVQERQHEENAAYINALKARSETAVSLKDYTFYAELNTSSFRPNQNAVMDLGLGGHVVMGTLVIRERSRAQSSSQANNEFGSPIALTVYEHSNQEMNTSEEGFGNNYWRTCDRFQDSGYINALNQSPSQPLIGYDFAEFAQSGMSYDASTHGQSYLPPSMGHHSQFKCLVFDETKDPSKDIYVSQVSVANDYKLNECVGNLADQASSIQCHADEPDLHTPWVGWGVANYSPASGGASYEHGCIDSFVYHHDHCPGFSPAAPSVIFGEGNQENYGALLCGCTKYFGGLSCDLGCPEENLIYDYALNKNIKLQYSQSTRPLWGCFEPSDGVNTIHSNGITFQGRVGVYPQSNMSFEKDSNIYRVDIGNITLTPSRR